MTTPLLDTSNDHFRRVDGEMRKMMVSQIARMTLFAISGGRVTAIEHGIKLPVSSGMAVTVELDGNDSYVVRRVFTRVQGGEVKTWLHGERTDVYCEELSEVCYYASCYKSYDAETWPTKA